MQQDQKSVLLLSMPFAGVEIPSIQLGSLEAYLKERNINITTRHLYLKAADFYSVKNYNSLIYPPNDSYTAQMAFSRYVFPEHWKKNIDKFKEYYNKNKQRQGFTFDEYVRKTDDFYNWVISDIDWQMYDIIGFTLNYGQFLPSLAIAKEIKERYPDKIIVFGGSRTTGELGKKVLEIFPYIDFIVSGDGEEALYRLAADFNSYLSIPNLIFRKEKDIIWNESKNEIDLNGLPIPIYESYYKELCSVSPEVQQFFFYNGKLPIEISRGCWWNKCSFCNLNIQHKKYREKNVERIVEEIDFLSDKYKILNFQIVSNNLLVKDTRKLCKRIIELGKDLSFFAEARADQLKRSDYTLLKQAGFNTIQTGIESFSSSYLKKMNKGVSVINNIAALKFCKENSIANEYNLIVGYPNEGTVDFEETKKNIQLFKQYLDPPNICNLRVVYGSAVYCNIGDFNIEKLDFFDIDGVMFPQEVLEKGFSFVYSFKVKKSKKEFEWEKLVSRWHIEREMLMIESVKSKNPVDQHVFYFVDGGSFIRIYDKRSLKNIQIFNLDEVEREIFLSCLDVVSLEKIKENLPHISEDKILSTLKDFEENNIVFREDDRFLSLPLKINHVDKTNLLREEKTESLVYN